MGRGWLGVWGQIPPHKRVEFRERATQRMNDLAVRQESHNEPKKIVQGQK
ncbi:hypothetical protein ACFQDF_33780 [Ectobacillus funiculus]|uniref:Uncharacterized protein n=1 Tax=Ectobacillus funiculus TaxID=137993 RepID=A0ABV5WJ45_9BACI